jgi:Xaa-Pro aminopeptidase
MTTPKEFEGRRRRVHRAMSDAGLDVLIVAGRGLIGQHGYLMYLTGYVPVIRAAYCVMAAGRPPILLVTTSSDIWLARRSGAVADIRLMTPGKDDPTGSAKAIREIVAESKLASPRVGVVGLEDIVSAAEYLSWVNHIPAAVLSPATAVLGAVKAIKTPTDIAAMRATARICDDALDSLLAALRAGKSLREATGVAEGQLRRDGAVEVLVYCSEHPHFLHRPSAAKPESGMLLTVFVEASNADGYWIELARMVAIGELDAAQRRIVALSLSAMDVAQSNLRHGVTAGAAYAVIEREINRGGLTTGLWYGHGVGVDHDQPAIGRDVPTPLEANMVIALHPHIVDEAAGVGASLCDTFLIDAEGGAPFSRHARDLIAIPPA